MNALIEHLRNVHFALVAICSVVIAAAFLSDDSALKTARADLATILGLQSSWDASFIASLAEKEADARLYQDWRSGLEQRKALRFEVPLGEGRTTTDLPLTIDLSQYYVTIDKTWRIGLADQTNAPDFYQRVTKRANAIPLERLTYLAPPGRLKDFADLWNSIEGGVPVAYVADIHRRALILDDQTRANIPVQVNIADEKSTKQIGRLGWSPRVKRQYSRAGVFDDLSVSFESSRVLGDFINLVDKLERPSIVIQATPALMMVNAQRAIAERAGAKWRPGTFEESFPELSSIFKDLKSIEVSQAGALLKTIEDSLAKEVELLGVEIPSQALNLWALVIVLLVQAYFGAQLRQCGLLLRPEDLYQPRGSGGDKEAPVWIGLYRHRVPRFMTFTTACVVPAALVVLVRGKLLSDDFSFGGLVIAVMLSSAAGAVAHYVHSGLKPIR